MNIYSYKKINGPLYEEDYNITTDHRFIVSYGWMF